MKSFGKILTIALVAVGCTVATAPKASACGANVITQPAIIDTSVVAPVVDTTLVQPAVIDSGCGVDTTLVQPAVIDTGCNSCVNTTLMQPAVIEPACGTPVCAERRHLLNLDTFLFGVHLF
jgi:hypothetical protein